MHSTRRASGRGSLRAKQARDNQGAHRAGATSKVFRLPRTAGTLTPTGILEHLLLDGCRKRAEWNLEEGLLVELTNTNMNLLNAP